MGPPAKKQRVQQNTTFKRIPRQPMRIIQGNRPELKGVDTNIALNGVQTNMASSDGMTVMNLIAPGTGSYNRVGRQTILKSLRYCGYFLWTKQTDTTIEPVWIRQVLVWDLQPNGIIPTKADIFGITNQQGVENSYITNPVKYDNTARFRILKDNILTTNATALSTTAGTSLQFILPYDEYVDLGIKKTTWSGQSTPATIADISTGALYLITMSSIDVGEGSSWVRNGYARLRYTD